MTMPPARLTSMVSIAATILSRWDSTRIAGASARRSDIVFVVAAVVAVVALLAWALLG